MRRALLAVFLAVSAFAGGREGCRPVPRTILVLYDSGIHKDVRDTRIHHLFEMPLNHLGLIVRYHDVVSGFPPLAKMQDVRGILAWFRSDSVGHPLELLAWAERAIDAGKRFVIIGELNAGQDLQGHPAPASATNRFLAKLGLETENWTAVTYDLQVVYKDPALIGFERPLPVVLPRFDRVRLIDPKVRSHLIVRRGNDAATEGNLVVTGPHGGWVANGYTHFANFRQDQLQWYINPFEFLRLAFATDEVPKLDTTTLSGRRIYYSHIDGDGWRNVTEVSAYRREKLSSAEVVLKELISPFPDLPVTVGPIVGDLDPDWFGTRESLSVARRILSVPWVEAGSHTYSHPLDWESLCLRFAASSAAAQDRTSIERVLAWFDPGQWTAFNRAIERYSRPQADEGNQPLRRGHSRMRSYDLYPFDLDQEVGGSIAFVNRLLPPGKRVQILQWSGTTLVPEMVLRAALGAGVRNVNGGDTRFDPEFNSYAWVAPLGRQSGALRQVYSSESNENTYTNLWNERYFGFRYLTETLRKTESPLRVKPFNLYYHMYSGEKQPGLDALLANLRYARSRDLAPITASHYSAIVDGFHSALIIGLGTRRWRIENRDGLNTVRFDHADAESVDWAASRGVVGQRHFQGSLYVSLDSAEHAPVVALVPPGKMPVASRPYLVESRWRISKLRGEASKFAFEACGFGPGEMEWATGRNANHEVRVTRGAGRVETLAARSNQEGRLRFTIANGAIDPVAVEVVRTGGER